MMVSVVRPRKSILSMPVFSRSDISNCVVNSCLLLTATGINSSSGTGLMTTPAAWTEEWRAQPSSRLAMSMTFLTCGSVSIACFSSGTVSMA